MVWKRGHSGNNLGRPKGRSIAQMIMDRTENGELLVEWALRVMAGTEKGMEDSKSRTYAHNWLGDRGLGRPLQSVDVLDVTAIAPEQTAMLAALNLTTHERRVRIAELRAKLPRKADETGGLSVAGRDDQPSDAASE